MGDEEQMNVIAIWPWNEVENRLSYSAGSESLRLSCCRPSFVPLLLLSLASCCFYSATALLQTLSFCSGCAAYSALRLKYIIIGGGARIVLHGTTVHSPAVPLYHVSVVPHQDWGRSY